MSASKQTFAKSYGVRKCMAKGTENIQDKTVTTVWLEIRKVEKETEKRTRWLDLKQEAYSKHTTMRKNIEVMRSQIL